MQSLSYYSQNGFILPFSLSPDNDYRFEGIISAIKEVDPDIIALQEIWPNSFVKRIKKELSNYSFIGGGTFFNKGGLVTGIKGKRITATNHTFTTARGSSLVEILGGKGYQILTLPKNVRFVNTHLYAPTKKAEEIITKAQFEFLTQLLRKRGGILAGDLNIEHIDFVRTNRLFRYSSPDEFTLSKDNKYANWKWLTKTPVSKIIDYVIGTGGIDITTKILVKETSDHYALTGTITYD